jgi:adhesin transport system outer membrane protein
MFMILKFLILNVGVIATTFSISASAQKLENLIALALSSNPLTKSQQTLVESAKVGVDSAKWQFYPTPSVSVEMANTSSSDLLYQGDKRVSIGRIQQPLWTGGRLSAGVNKAEAGLAVSQASLEEARLQLGLRVVQAYGDWLSAHLKTLANEKSLATHIRLHDQVKRRVNEGTSANSDLTLAIARLEAISAELTAVRAQGEVAIARLGQFLGNPVDAASLMKEVASPYSLTGNMQGVLEQAIDINPSIIKAQATARVQEVVIDEKRADLSPEVFVRAERQYGNYTFANGPPENRFFVGLTSRFGAGLSTLSGIEAARLQYTAALTDIEVQTRAVNEQVLSDYALAQSIASRIAAIYKSLSATNDVLSSYNRQFLAGRKSWLDVMNAARELTQTETQLADLHATQVVVTWRLGAYTRGIGALTEEVKSEYYKQTRFNAN